jgi:hypothetical protein
VITSIRHAIELAAIFEANCHSPFTRQLYDLFHAGILAPSSDKDAVKGAARLERFANRMNAGESIHGKRVYSLQLKVKS